MKSVAIGVIVLGNVLGGALAGCVLFDDTPVNQKACQVYCECLQPGDGACQANCESTVLTTTAGPRCTSCVLKHDNQCAGLEGECPAVCAEEGPITPPITGNAVELACSRLCACDDTPAPNCVATCVADPRVQAVSTECLTCFANLSAACDVGDCQAVCN